MNSKPNAAATLLGWFILLVIGRQVVTLWLVERYVVNSGSMYPALVGIHCQTRCDACGREYQIGLDAPTGDLQRAICPECGASGKTIESLPVLNGDRVWIDKGAYYWREPRRWEVVAFRSPSRAAQVHVKRIVGLPGESIQIRSGDIYINGEIAERSFEQVRAMSLLVHESRSQPPQDTGHGPHWRTERANTAWQHSQGEWHYDAKEQRGSDPLVFESRRRVPGNPDKSEPWPVRNLDGYNQTRPIRELFDVVDLWMTGEVRSDTTFDVFTYNQPKKVAPGNWQLWSRWVDGVEQTWTTAPGDSKSSSDAEPSTFGKPAPSATPFKIAPSGPIELRGLRVYRDIYYTAPVALDAALAIAQPYQLGPDEYFVLGDNSTAAVDSRYPSYGPVKEEWLVGKPILPR